MRIEEPFLKAHYVLWLVDQGAEDVTLSVDGAEPYPEQVAEILGGRGYSRSRLPGSTVTWTGRFMRAGKAQILVVSRPGLDVEATLPEGGLLAAECKGEPTAKGGNVELATDFEPW